MGMVRTNYNDWRKQTANRLGNNWMNSVFQPSSETYSPDQGLLQRLSQSGYATPQYNEGGGIQSYDRTGKEFDPADFDTFNTGTKNYFGTSYSLGDLDQEFRSVARSPVGADGMFDAWQDDSGTGLWDAVTDPEWLSGLAFMAGPWAGSMLGPALGGGLTGAMGSGAVLGGATSALTGGNPLTGALMGGGMGAAGYGINSGLEGFSGGSTAPTGNNPSYWDGATASAGVTDAPVYDINPSMPPAILDTGGSTMMPTALGDAGTYSSVDPSSSFASAATYDPYASMNLTGLSVDESGMTDSGLSPDYQDPNTLYGDGVQSADAMVQPDAYNSGPDVTGTGGVGTTTSATDDIWAKVKEWMKPGGPISTVQSGLALLSGIKGVGDTKDLESKLQQMFADAKAQQTPYNYRQNDDLVNQYLRDPMAMLRGNAGYQASVDYLDKATRRTAAGQGYTASGNKDHVMADVLGKNAMSWMDKAWTPIRDAAGLGRPDAAAQFAQVQQEGALKLEEAKRKSREAMMRAAGNAMPDLRALYKGFFEE
jgi:hypothetical protein